MEYFNLDSIKSDVIRNRAKLFYDCKIVKKFESAFDEVDKSLQKYKNILDYHLPILVVFSKMIEDELDNGMMECSVSFYSDYRFPIDEDWCQNCLGNKKSFDKFVS